VLIYYVCLVGIKRSDCVYVQIIVFLGCGPVPFGLER